VRCSPSASIPLLYRDALGHTPGRAGFVLTRLELSGKWGEGTAADNLSLCNSAGKSSIRKVVFEGMAPSDTLFIERTNKSSLDDIKCVSTSLSSSRREPLAPPRA